MPSEDESLSGSSPSGVTRGAAFLTTASAGGSSAGPVAVASTAVSGEGAQASGPAGSGHGRRGGKIFSLPGRRQHSSQGDSASAAEAGLPGAAAVSAGARTAGAAQAAGRPGATATQTGRGGRPLFVAAAVAGAVLATVPFIHGRGGTTNYEGLGQAVPIASLSPDGDGNLMAEPDGNASSMPLQDTSAGTQEPIVPQPQISPVFRPGSKSGVASGPAEGAFDLGNEAALAPGGHGPLVGPRLYTDQRGLGPTVGSPTGPSPAVPDGKDGPLLGKGLGLALPASGDKPEDEKTEPKGSKPVEADDASRPEEKRKTVTEDAPATSTSVSLLSAKSSDATEAKPAVKTEAKPAVKTADKATATSEDTSVATQRKATVKAATSAKEATPVKAEVKSAAVKATPVKATAARAATPVKAATPVSAATPEWGTRVVQATTVIGPGESVASNRMRITMGTNGNLVISDENGVVRWSSHTEGRGYKAVFQADGHFVVYTQDNQTAWSSGTAGNPGAQLVIQGDGNVTIQSASGAGLWSAGTQH
ncbi:hypothetical protein ABZ707_21195 [Streptomyces sp. NPDC006923]|uniref:hypothetical protein n=1 Tax=Streptomyces sp. NPDC006923 TaxID=3155355 RepID=UPI0033E7FEFB